MPDLRGRTPVHVGQTKTISYFNVGDKGGSKSKELRKVKFSEKEPTGKTYETYTVRNGNPDLDTRDPYLGINYIIALQGVFPSRNY